MSQEEKEEGNPLNPTPATPDSTAAAGDGVDPSTPVEQQLERMQLDSPSTPSASTSVRNLTEDLTAESTPSPSAISAPSAAPSSSSASSSSATSASSAPTLDLTSTLLRMQTVVNNALENAHDGKLSPSIFRMMDTLFDAEKTRKQRARGKSSAGPRSGNRQASSSSRPSKKSRQQPREVPVCTYPACNNKVGHDVSTCFQKFPNLRPQRSSAKPAPADGDKSEDD